MAVPLRDTDMELLWGLQELMNRYGMAGVKSAVEQMSTAHGFERWSPADLNCTWCGLPAGSDLHGAGQTAH